MSPQQYRFDQRLFGLRVRSNLPIPYGLPDAPDHPGFDVLATLGSLPPWLESESLVTLPLSRINAPYKLELAGDARSITYPDGTRFIITGNELWMSWEPPLDFDDASTYLVGGALSLLVRLRGSACLHASAVLINGETMAFAGPSGAGKSTLVAALVRRGATLVSEDVLPLSLQAGRIHASPAHHGIRLWPEAVELLTGDREAMPRISSTWDKRAFIAERVASADSPLRGVLVFEETEEDLQPATAAMRLIANSYHPEMLDRDMRRQEFEIFTTIADTLSVRTLVRGHHTPDALASLVMDAFSFL